MLWEEAYPEVLIAAGFTRGKISPCCFFHAGRQISVVCHGDDFSAPGTKADLDWYRDMSGKAFEIGDCKMLGDEAGEISEVMKLHSHGLTLEADPRHIELLVRSLNLAECRKVPTSGDKPKHDDINYASGVPQDSDDDDSQVDSALQSTTTLDTLSTPIQSERLAT